MTAPRRRLPNRRPIASGTVFAGDAAFVVSAGFDPASGRVREVFLSAEKHGSALDVFAHDAAVVISVALQCGVSAAQLAHSVARTPAGPATPIGAALDWIERLEERE